MATEFVRVSGVLELQRALQKADKETAKILRGKLKDVGEVVRADAAARFADIDAGSAAGFRTRVRAKGIVVSVEQSKRKVTGLRPDYGPLQMRHALEPALEDKKDEVNARLEDGLQEICDIVNHERIL